MATTRSLDRLQLAARLVVSLALLLAAAFAWRELEGLSGAIVGGLIAHWTPPLTSSWRDRRPPLEANELEQPAAAPADVSSPGVTPREPKGIQANG